MGNILERITPSYGHGYSRLDRGMELDKNKSEGTKYNTTISPTSSTSSLSEQLNSDTPTTSSTLPWWHWNNWTLGDIIKVSVVLVFIIVILILLIMAFIPDSPIQNIFIEFLNWIRTIDIVLSCIIITAVYAVALLFMLPGTPFNLAAGFLFKIWLGSAVALIGVIVGAMIAFFLGRFILRDWAVSQMKTKPKLRALDKAVERHGFKLIFLTRLSPILPFPLLNYLFGVTNVTTLNYFISTTLGIIPLTVAYCWIGGALKDLNDVWSGNNSNLTETIIWLVAAIGGTLLVVIVTVIITRNAIRNALKETEDEENSKHSITAEGESLITKDDKKVKQSGFCIICIKYFFFCKF